MPRIGKRGGGKSALFGDFYLTFSFLFSAISGLATAGPSLFSYALATGSPWLNAGVTSVTVSILIVCWH